MIPKRYLVVCATFLLSVLLYVDRVCVSTAKGQITHDLGLTDTQFGWVMSSFAIGYALFQTPSGMLADKLGARKILTAIVASWSIFTGLSAVAWNYGSMLVIRFLFGAGEAGAFPGMARTVYSWIPTQERGLVKGINFSGSRLGAAFALPVLGITVESLGWKLTFAILMVIGCGWSLAWWLWFRDDPSEHNGISAQELAYIRANRQGGAAPPVSGRLPLGHMFRSSSLWLMMTQYLFSNFTAFFCLTWLYPHIKGTYNLSAGGAGLYAMVPLLCGAAGNIFSGWLVDRIYASGHRHLSRKLPAIAGFLLTAVGMIISVQQTSVGPAVFWLSVAVFGVDMILSPSWSFCIDIGGQHAGQVSGTMNMAGNIGSAIIGPAFPFLLHLTGSADVFFYLIAVFSVLAALCWVVVDPSRKIAPPSPA
ncbi:MFS transporter [Oleiharenicola lentus]|uniref:MFS transporter n=1 Tax=Oleiharenicola lentus TaxID=2508720 RepID=A0A4Q1CBN3_9BACT|nr:MFS transporter [Oleiharenicola lentus]RXK56341.1 MFS transporter [Oleiharenicola lentus]